MYRRFRDRAAAGRMLAQRLDDYAGRSDVLVLALPRGGVPVAYEVARRLRVKLDVFVVRKLGVPGHEELAMGAIASGGMRVINPLVVQQLYENFEQTSDQEVRDLLERARRESRPDERTDDSTPAEEFSQSER